MAREFTVVRVNPSNYNPGRKKHSAIGRKFDACVRGVRRRGGAYDPEAVCAATMRRKYGKKFQQLSIRARQARARARHNPVQEIVQTHAFGPGHYSVEWVDADDGQWFHSRDLRHVKIRPPLEPGEHLVAPGALLLIMRHNGATILQYTRANFIKHHHHWKYLTPAGQPVHAVANGSKMKITSPHPQKSDVAVMETMFAYVKYEEREHGEAPRENPHRHARHATRVRVRLLRFFWGHRAGTVGFVDDGWLYLKGSPPAKVSMLDERQLYELFPPRVRGNPRRQRARRGRAKPRRPSYARHPAAHRRYTAKDRKRAREVLGLPARASQDDVKRAFRVAAIRHHPDRGGDLAQFQAAVRARDALQSP